MKSVNGESNMNSDDEDDESVSACPAATFDIFTRDGNLQGTPSNKEKKVVREPKTKATILLKTKRRERALSADEFINDRTAAMKKLQSSRYANKYNFGGYIPGHEGGNIHIEPFSMDDFDNHLGTKYCDFLPRVLFEQKRKVEEKRRDIEALDLIKTEQAKKEQDEIDMTKQRMVEVFRHDRKLWNPAVLEYMDDSLPSSGEGDKKEAVNVIPSVFLTSDDMATNLDVTENENLKDEALKAVEAVIKKDAEADLNLQKELEYLWVSLHMPLDQKLDMAIKYGSHKASHISTVYKY